RIGLFSGARLGCIVLLPLGGGASSVAGGAFWASAEPAATIITHARITRLMNILLVGPDKPSFPSEEPYSRSCNTRGRMPCCEPRGGFTPVPGFPKTRLMASAVGRPILEYRCAKYCSTISPLT